MKKIGFLSFGHYRNAAGSMTPSAQDAILQQIELTVAAEEIGVDGPVRGVATQHRIDEPLNAEHLTAPRSSPLCTSARGG